MTTEILDLEAIAGECIAKIEKNFGINAGAAGLLKAKAIVHDALITALKDARDKSAPTQHAGDCTIYASVINQMPFDGICTCGYGWHLVRETGGDWKEMRSEERFKYDIDRDRFEAELKDARRERDAHIGRSITWELECHSVEGERDQLRAENTALKAKVDALASAGDGLMRAVKGYIDNKAVPIGPQSTMTEWVNEAYGKLRAALTAYRADSGGG